MHAALALGRSVLKGAVDFALPPRCPGCGEITADPHAFCVRCWSSLGFLGDPCCAVCALPFEFDAGTDALCGGCLAFPPRFDRMRAAVRYDDVSRKVALRLKYGARPGAAGTMARFMARHVEADTPWLVVPVPLHRWRIWKRGYNQAALIATALARRGKLERQLDLLRRTRATPPLKGMSPRQREEAVRGAFAIRPGGAERIAGRPVLLVDDVFTTGATANACARVLKKAGASRVDLLCWARVVRDGAD